MVDADEGEMDSPKRDSDMSLMSSMDGEDNCSVDPMIRITQHFFNNDGLNYSDHYYVVEVKVKELMYSVDRSVLDFVDLDRKMRKRFGSIKLDSLPFKDGVLEALTGELKSLDEANKEKGPGGDRESDSSSFSPTRAESVSYTGEEVQQRARSRSSLFGGAAKMSRPVQVASTDRMDRKVISLTRYLEGLLRHHEVIVADEFLLFFDEEAPSMFVSPSSLEPLTIHDLLLLNEPVYRCIVRKKEEVVIEVEPGQLVLWKFGTADFDIAFGIDLNGEAKIKPSRYNSHYKPVCGTLLVQNSGRASEVEVNGSGALRTPPPPPAPSSVAVDGSDNIKKGSGSGAGKAVCTLTFDNTYAKLHTKKLQWSARVVSYAEYSEAKEKALDVMAEKRKFEIQRHSFARYMIMTAMLQSGVIHSSSVREDFLREEMLSRRANQEQIQQLNGQLEGAEERVTAAESARAAAELNATNINDSWKFTTAQLEKAEAKVGKLGESLDEYSKKQDLAEMAAREQAKQSVEREEVLKRELAAALKRAKEKESENDQLASAMELALRQADDTVNALEAKLKTAQGTVDDLRSDMVARGSMEPSQALNGRIDDALERISVSRKSIAEREKRKSTA
jgi:hypothetical protein